MKYAVVLCCAVLIFFSSCSSAPERPAAVYTLRNKGQSALEQANVYVNRGEYKQAEIRLKEARRAAVAADDPQLRVRTDFARGNMMFVQKDVSQAVALWTAAFAEADSYHDAVLSAAAQLYLLYADLCQIESGGYTAADNVPERPRLQSADIAVKAAALADVVSSSLMDYAFALKIQAIALYGSGDFARAADVMQKAVTQHEELRYFEDAAYDAYVLASFYSRSGDRENARIWLNRAIDFDRRCENSFGLVSDWNALAAVEEKSGNAAAAQKARDRAADIQSAINTK